MLLKKAVEWGVIDRMPCTIRLLKITRWAATFYDFDQYECLVEAARAVDRTAELIVLLGGEAGLRCAEMMALEWRDVDLTTRQLCIQRPHSSPHVLFAPGDARGTSAGHSGTGRPF